MITLNLLDWWVQTVALSIQIAYIVSITYVEFRHFYAESCAVTCFVVIFMSVSGITQKFVNEFL